MRKSIAIVSAIVAVLLAGVAQAEVPVASKKITAEIFQTTGKVLINQGHGFVVASTPVRLVVGDQVMVGYESSAEVVYSPNGCTLSINQGSIVTIGAKSPCQKGEVLAMAGQVIITPTFGSGTGSDYAHAINLIPVVVMLGVVAAIASTYDEPDPASTP